ncbi:MAG: DUF4340 domain-containing protein, partial [Bacteroidota bacterium]
IKRVDQGEWVVNDSLPANRETLKRLLQVIHSVEVKSRVAKTAYNNVVGDLAATAIKVEIYTDGNDEPEKTYYVGGHTQDALGTFMILEDSKMPFVTEIPGFNGYLTPWYPTRLEDWMRNMVFDIGTEDFRSISIEYPAFADRSFSLSKKDTLFTLNRLSSEANTEARIPKTMAMNYLVHLKGLPYLQEARMLGAQERDSVSKTIPLAIVTVTSTSGASTSVSLHPMPVSDRSLVKEDDSGKPLEFDLDHMYCRIPRQPYWVIVQHYTFDPVLQRYDELLKLSALTD